MSIYRFFDRIGPTNARRIQYICMNLPLIIRFFDLVFVDGINAHIMAEIQEVCINVKTIIIDPSSAGYIKYRLSTRDPESVTTILSLIDTCLGEGFPNLETIVIYFYCIPTDDVFMGQMERLGWIIRKW